MNAGRYAVAIGAARRLEAEIRKLLDPDAGAVLLGQAHEAHDAGRDEEAVRLLDDALAATADPILRGRIQQLRGWVEFDGNRRLAAHELLVTEAALVEPHDPGLAVELLADAALAASFSSEPGATRAAATAARALGARASGNSAVYAEVVLAVTRVASGDGGRDAILARRALGELLEATDVAVERFQPVAAALLWLEEYEAARLILERLIDRARRESLVALPGVLDTLAAVDFRTGRWSAAEARSTEALRLARELTRGFQVGSCLTTLARIAAGRGDEERCRTLVRTALELASPNDLVYGYAVSAAGLLEIGRGNAEAAVDQLEQLALTGAAYREPMVVPWAPDLVEGYVRTGRSADAVAALRRFEQQVGDRPRTWARAAIARCRGMLAAGDAFEAHFDEALAWHVKTTTPFERARTELCFGERLRRARRSADARPHLLSALGTFERLGAQPWADRARRELGHRRPQKGSFGVESLTAHEREVAALVARGATNREAAAALVVSPKTIEYHLGSIYRKLDVRSRTELALAVRGGL